MCHKGKKNLKCLKKNTGEKSSKSIRMVFSCIKRRKRKPPVTRWSRDFREVISVYRERVAKLLA